MMMMFADTTLNNNATSGRSQNPSTSSAGSDAVAPARDMWALKQSDDTYSSAFEGFSQVAASDATDDATLRQLMDELANLHPSDDERYQTNTNSTGSDHSSQDGATTAANAACNLTVSGLPRRIDSPQLTRIFEKFGPILSAMVMLDTHSGRSRGFGFVWFEKEEDAHNAIAATHGKKVLDVFDDAVSPSGDDTDARDAKLRVFPSAKPGKLAESSAVLFANWPNVLTHDESHAILARCGKIKSVEMGDISAVRKHPVRALRASFASAADARRAVSQMHGVRSLRVDDTREVGLPLPLVTKFGAEMPCAKPPAERQPVPAAKPADAATLRAQGGPHASARPEHKALAQVPSAPPTLPMPPSAMPGYHPSMPHPSSAQWPPQHAPAMYYHPQHAAAAHYAPYPPPQGPYSTPYGMPHHHHHHQQQQPQVQVVYVTGPPPPTAPYMASMPPHGHHWMPM